MPDTRRAGGTLNAQERIRHLEALLANERLNCAEWRANAALWRGAHDKLMLAWSQVSPWDLAFMQSAGEVCYNRLLYTRGRVQLNGTTRTRISTADLWPAEETDETLPVS